MGKNTTDERSELRERFAALAHDQWAGWMKYLFDKGQFNADGTWTMPAWAVNRWTRQMGTPYEKLSEHEKESDRKEADKFLSLVQDDLFKEGYGRAWVNLTPTVRPEFPVNYEDPY